MKILAYATAILLHITIVILKFIILFPLMILVGVAGATIGMFSLEKQGELYIYVGEALKKIKK